MASLAGGGLRKGAPMQHQNRAGKKEGEGGQNQKPPTKNQPGGGSAAKKPRRRASQGNPLGGTRPPRRLAPRKGHKEPPTQLGLLVQVWGHVFKTFFRFPPNQEKAYSSQRAQNRGGDITGQEDLAHYVRSFYACLYTSEASAPGTSKAREICWGSTPTRVSNMANDELTKELTLKEIKEAIVAMPKDKAPGCDGIPREFFQELIEEISPTLLQALSAMLRRGETS